MRLRLDFADGWSHDRVVVSAGGRELCRLDDITTRPATNLARQVEVELDPADAPGGELELEVAVPDRRVAASYRVAPGEDRLVVDAQRDGLTIRSPEGPYGYG